MTQPPYEPQQPYYPPQQPYYPPQQPYYPPPMPTAPAKSPGVAAVLSFLIPGAGHVYTLRPLMALLWFGLAVVAVLSIAAGIGLLLVPIVWVGAMAHAASSASAFNHQHGR